MKHLGRALWVVAFCAMLPVWGLQVWQSRLSRTAKTMGELEAAMAVPSPVGNFGAEVLERYLRLPQTVGTLNAALPYVPDGGPRRSAILVILTVRTKGAACPLLVEWAPKREDTRQMCLTGEKGSPTMSDKGGKE